MLATLKRDWRAAVVQGVIQAIAIIGLLIVVSYGLGEPQRERDAAREQAALLAQIQGIGRAQVCVLALPISENGRKPADVAACLDLMDDWMEKE
jgi:hypothetical protein